MCTLIGYAGHSWCLLGMNRDDEKSRVHSEYYDADGIFYPIDPRAGGTWIGVSLEGKIAALLNGHTTQTGETSRGEIVPRVLRGEQVENLPLNQYASFTLVQYDPTPSHFTTHHYDGEDLVLEGSTNKVVCVSSSYGVRKKKTAWVKKKIEEDEKSALLLVDHMKTLLKNHEPKKGPGSICMHSDRGSTLASTVIGVSQGMVQVYSTMGNPCEGTHKLVKHHIVD